MSFRTCAEAKDTELATTQEAEVYIGYCLIPSNKGQRMMVIKGEGGEGKSQIGAVLAKLFGRNMKDGSIGKISENRFARADLEHILLCVDDDMRMEALRQTNYVKSMDEKTPHMHLAFVPLTADGRLSAKEIVGNKKKLSRWQDKFWEHMVKKYPDLERGESASQTGRDHIPPRLFKEAVHLNRMKEQIMAMMADTNLLNKKAKTEELEALLEKYVPAVEDMRTKLKKYSRAYSELREENARLEKRLSSATEHSLRKKMEIQQKLGELEELRRTVEELPPEILNGAKRAAVNKVRER